MSDLKSYRQILRSSYVIGGASVLSIVIGLARTKLVAYLLGPAGIGLIGLLQNLMMSAATLAGLGLGNAGTRQIAEAAGREDQLAIHAARRALMTGTIFLALLGAVVVWMLRDVLARHVIGDPASSATVGWLGLGVALTVAASAQAALLNGLRRIGDIARVSVFSAILSTVLGAVGLLYWGERAIWLFLLAAPLATFLVGHWYVAKLPKTAGARLAPGTLTAQWRVLARLGVAVTLAGVVGLLAQLVVRSMVQRQLGAESLGQFQASWQISMTYLGFVLTAMGTDYYPRLTGVISDHRATVRMVNDQTEVAILLGGAVLLAMMGLAPWIIELLYSNQFKDSAAILRWQIAGDFLKILSWPLGFILLAANNGRTFLLAEMLAYAVFVGLTWAALPWLGVEATGLAFLGMYAVYLPAVYMLGRQRVGRLWNRRIVTDAASLLALLFGVMMAANQSAPLGALVAVVGALGWSGYALVRLAALGAVTGRIGAWCARAAGVVHKSDR